MASGSTSETKSKNLLGSLSPFAPFLSSVLFPSTAESGWTLGPMGFQPSAKSGSKADKKQVEKWGQTPIDLSSSPILSALQGMFDPVFAGGLRDFENFAINDLPIMGIGQVNNAMGQLDTLRNKTADTTAGLESFNRTGFPMDLAALTGAAQTAVDPLKTAFQRTLERDIIPSIQQSVGNVFNTDIGAQGLEAATTGFNAIDALTTDLIDSGANRALQSFGTTFEGINNEASLIAQMTGLPFELANALIGIGQSGRNLAFGASPSGSALNTLLMLAGLPTSGASVGKGGGNTAAGGVYLGGGAGGGGGETTQ